MSRTSTSHEEHPMRFTIATTSSQAEHPALKSSILRLELMSHLLLKKSLHPVPGYKVKRSPTVGRLSSRLYDRRTTIAAALAPAATGVTNQAMIIPFTAGILQDHSSSPPRSSWRRNPAPSSRADAESCRASSRMWAPLPPQPAAGAEQELWLAHRPSSCAWGKSFRIRP